MSSHVKSIASKNRRQGMESSRKEQKTISLGRFFADVKSEFKKMTWTGKEELKTYTKIVVACTFIFGMLIYLVDITIQSVLSSFGVLVHMIAG